MWPSFRAVPPELSAAGPFTYVGRLITCEGIFDRSPAEKERDMPAYDYDVLVVGAGQGGLPAAHMAANLGAQVALIEEREVGGT